MDNTQPQPTRLTPAPWFNRAWIGTLIVFFASFLVYLPTFNSYSSIKRFGIIVLALVPSLLVNGYHGITHKYLQGKIVIRGTMAVVLGVFYCLAAVAVLWIGLRMITSSTTSL